VIQKGLPLVQPGMISVLHWKRLTDSDKLEAPESLTGCGYEMPDGFFECISGLVVEVCAPIIPGLLAAYLTSILDDLLDYDCSQSIQELELCRCYAAFSGLDPRWWHVLSSPRSLLQFEHRFNHEQSGEPLYSIVSNALDLLAKCSFIIP